VHGTAEQLSRRPLIDALKSRIMCGYAVDGVRLWHPDDHFTLESGQECNQAFSKNAANRGRKRRKHPFEHRPGILGIITAATTDKVNAHEVKKGTVFDDES
jgi:hypothetical protein